MRDMISSLSIVLAALPLIAGIPLAQKPNEKYGPYPGGSQTPQPAQAPHQIPTELPPKPPATTSTGGSGNVLGLGGLLGGLVPGFGGSTGGSTGGLGGGLPGLGGLGGGGSSGTNVPLAGSLPLLPNLPPVVGSEPPAQMPSLPHVTPWNPIPGGGQNTGYYPHDPPVTPVVPVQPPTGSGGNGGVSVGGNGGTSNGGDQDTGNYPQLPQGPPTGPVDPAQAPTGSGGDGGVSVGGNGGTSTGSGGGTLAPPPGNPYGAPLPKPYYARHEKHNVETSNKRQAVPSLDSLLKLCNSIPAEYTAVFGGCSVIESAGQGASGSSSSLSPAQLAQLDTVLHAIASAIKT